MTLQELAGVREVRRGSVLDVDLEPTQGSETGKSRPAVVVTNDRYNRRAPILQVVPLTAWSERKAAILTNVVLEATRDNGLDKVFIADCLQTRPIDRRVRVLGIRGHLESEAMARIDQALRTYGVGVPGSLPGHDHPHWRAPTPDFASGDQAAR